MKRFAALLGLGLVALLCSAQVVQYINTPNEIPDVATWSKNNADVMVWDVVLRKWTNAPATYTWTNLATNIFLDQFNTNGPYVSLADSFVSTNQVIRGSPTVTNFANAVHLHTNAATGGDLTNFQDFSEVLERVAGTSGGVNQVMVGSAAGWTNKSRGAPSGLQAWDADLDALASDPKLYQATNTALTALAGNPAMYQATNTTLTRLAGIGAGTSGDVIIRNATGWTNLAKGTSGQVLKMGSSLPAWGTDESGGGSGSSTNLDNLTVTNAAVFQDDVSVDGELSVSGTGDNGMDGLIVTNTLEVLGNLVVSGTGGSNTLDAAYVTNGVNFYTGTLNVSSAATNHIVNVTNNSVLNLVVTNHVHFQYATNLISGVNQSMQIRLMNGSGTNQTVSCCTNWWYDGFPFTLTNNKVAVVSLNAWGGTSQTNVFAVRANAWEGGNAEVTETNDMVETFEGTGYALAGWDTRGIEEPDPDYTTPIAP